ncbi:MAG: Taurine dehydrogenase small subunit [Chloroflexi bacterium]|nr:Taurine dehydrogenase small subunit [Chloroflexota bacterium]
MTTEIETTTDTGNVALFERYLEAWSTSNVEQISAMTHPEGVYEASYGPLPHGNRFVGPAGIKAGLDAMHAASTNRSSTHDYHHTYLYGDLAFARWTSTFVDKDGNEGSVEGADFFEFKGGLVLKKLAYRKTITG